LAGRLTGPRCAHRPPEGRNRLEERGKDVGRLHRSNRVQLFQKREASLACRGAAPRRGAGPPPPRPGAARPLISCTEPRSDPGRVTRKEGCPGGGYRARAWCAGVVAVELATRYAQRGFPAYQAACTKGRKKDRVIELPPSFMTRTPAPRESDLPPRGRPARFTKRRRALSGIEKSRILQSFGPASVRGRSGGLCQLPRQPSSISRLVEGQKPARQR
jgi:hypothetical protein